MISSISSLTRFGSAAGDLQIVVQREIGVGEGLGFHALGGVHHQHRALTGGEGAGDLIVEVHVARGVDEVQGMALPVAGLIIEAHGAGLDGDASLALEIHVIEDLILHDALLHRAALFDQAVGECGLAVVDMGNNGEIPDVFLSDHRSASFVSLSPRDARASSMTARSLSR